MYFDRSCLENILSIKLPEDLEEISDVNILLSSPSNAFPENKSPFNYLIGANTSLKIKLNKPKQH